ncbi:MAG: endonuclease domain-containing protein [Kiritimatiellae bacterium]|nr:endonuclease domain-containing protein [Kiritimatiellia bacterium]MDD5522912.1 endonuclease domain-containing protein [Kiritimatiellia bacterium]
MLSDNKYLARSLRKKMTWAEKALWLHLRDRKLVRTKFRRQQPFGPYILDFYCAERKLSVEIDGGQHDFPDQKIHDLKRNNYLESKGVRVLRFWNSQIMENIEAVLTRIKSELEKIDSSPLRGEEQGEGEK